MGYLKLVLDFSNPYAYRYTNSNNGAIQDHFGYLEYNFSHELFPPHFHNTLINVVVGSALAEKIFNCVYSERAPRFVNLQQWGFGEFGGIALLDGDFRDFMKPLLMKERFVYGISDRGTKTSIEYKN